MSVAEGNQEWIEKTFDLSDYNGQKGYIAIHHLDYDMNYLFIDDFEVTAPVGTALKPDATRKVWTLDAMPAGNVELQVAYFPGMLTLPAKTAQGSIEVVGLSLGGPKAFDVPAAWSSDETMLSANDLPADFAAIDDADLPATISALSSDAGALLIYGFAGEKTKVVSYVNGTKDDTDAGFIKRYDVTGWIEGGFKIYYTTATTLPAGFDTDGTNYYVEPKTQFQVKAVPAEGYHLVSLSDGTNTYDVDANGIATVTMPEGDADLTLTATFSDEFELTFDDVNFKTNQNITVKVGEADKTLDQDGKLSVKSGQTVTLTAKQGYKFRSVEAKKAGPAVKTFNCAGVELIYEDGDTWAKVIERNPGKIYDDSGWIGRSDTNFFLIEGEVLNNGNQIITTDKIVDPTATYSWQAG